ncbi:putative ribonuclease H-like domain-containing protein [Tanacetum coccineum]
MHAVPPPMTGNYMPSGLDREVDDSMFTYGPKQSKTSESDTQTTNFDSCESNSSVETLESVPEPVVVEPKVVSQPKVWSDAPIIEEYESDSDDEYVIQPSKEQERPSSAFVKHVKTHRETVKEQNTYSLSPKVDKRDWNGLMSKRMAKQVELNKKKGKVTGQGENRPVWNNVQRLNHQNQFVQIAVLTRTGRIPVNTTSHNCNSQAISTSAARKVNAVRPIVNENRPRNNFCKTHSPIRRPFNRTTAPRTKFSNQKVNTTKVKAVSAVGGKRKTAVKPSTGCNWRPKRHYWNKFSKYNGGSNSRKCDNPQRALKNKGIVDSGCSRHMTGNKAYLAEYQDYNGGPVAFGGSKGYITGKGKIKTGKLDFEDVCFVKELQHFNLFSVSQMCDKKNKVLFTDTKCLVLSSDFKFPNENQVLLRIPRQNNMYSFNLENIVPSGGLACLIAKATVDESNKWHRRLGHVNFKNLNKLVKGNLVRGLPSKIFQNDHTCVACQKGKQHKASCKAKIVSSISQPLQLLHMDLFGPTSVRSINHKTYCLVITDDFSRDIIEFYGSKGIKREYSNARTPQQNGVAERKNMALIEAGENNASRFILFYLHFLGRNTSIRSDLLFDDADGIYSLPNQAIFDAIQLMGYEGDLTLVNVPVPLDHFPVNALTSKVFSFMVKKGKHFSEKVTPLFASMLVQSTEDEGATSERPSEPQPTPSPPHPSEVNVEPQSDPSPRPSPTPHIPDSILEVSGGNQGGQSSSDRSLSGTEGGMTLQSVYDLCISLCTQVTDQAKEIKNLKAQIKKLKKQAKPVITHHKVWMKSVSLKQRLAGKKSLKSNWMQKESVSKQGRKSAKAESSVHKDPLFDELDDDEIDNMDTEDAQDVGRSRDVVNEEKENDDAEVSTEDVLSTAQQNVSTDKEKVSTDRPKVSTDGSKVSTDKEKDSTDRTYEGTDDQTEGRRATQTTQTTTSTMFGDDETIAQVLLNMSQAKAVSREKEKGVEFKDVEETERPRPTSTRSLLTLKPLLKIDPKDKGKKKIEEEDESETESEGIPEAEKKFKQLASDEEMARKLQEDWETKVERKRLAEEEVTNESVS